MSDELDGVGHRAQHCVIFGVDVAGFTDVKRDDEVQLAIRDALYAMLTEAFDGTRLYWENCLHEDRGDGILVIIPATMPSATVVDPLLDHIRAGLRRHNKMASDAATIALRVAVHIGEVHRDRHGLAGTAVNLLFRLLDAPVLRQALADSGADMALMVSDYFFESVIRHGSGTIDPATFRPAAVAVKQTRVRGWIHVPGVLPAVPLGTEIADGSEIEPADGTPGAQPRDLYGTARRPPPEARSMQGFMFFGPAIFHGDAVAGNKIVNGRKPEDPWD